MNKYNGVDLLTPKTKRKKKASVFNDTSFTKFDKEAVLLNKNKNDHISG